MFMNECEIEEAVAKLRGEPRRYARYLERYKDAVDGHGDGWAHWAAGWKAANRLTALLRVALEVREGRRPAGEAPTGAEFEGALRPIRALCTRHGLGPIAMPVAETA